MKILLTAPRNGLMIQYHFPLGIAYISSVLKKAGHDVYCHNNALEENNRESFIEQLKTVRPEAIAIGGLTPSYKDIKNLIDIAKEMLPQVPVVVGGGVLSSEPDVFIPLGADVGLIGEGEVTSVALFEALEKTETIWPVWKESCIKTLPGR